MSEGDLTCLQSAVTDMEECDPHHLLIVDDDLELTALLREYLCAEGFLVDVLHSGGEVVPAATSGHYDAVILDVMLPELSGTEILRQIRQVSDVLVIMLTAKGDKADRTSGLVAGADDYVAKPYHPPELVARLRSVLRRRGVTKREGPDDIAAIGNLSLDPNTRRAICEGKTLDLTNTEFLLLLSLVRSGEAVTSKDELSLQVLRRARAPYDRSLDVHVSNLRNKLTVLRTAPNIEAVRGVGYRLIPK